MKRKYLLLSPLIFLVFTSCEESRIACLDVFARNYDVGAIAPCDSCCIYPEVELDFALIADTIGYDRGSYIFNKSGDSLAIHDFEIILTDFEFVSVDSSYRIINQLERGNYTIPDDYFLLHPANLGSELLGNTSFEDQLESIHFMVGVDRTMTDSLKPFSTLEETSMFAELADSTYNSDTDRFVSLAIAYSLQDTVISIFKSEEFSSELNFPFDFFVGKGVDWEIGFALDVLILFDGIDSNTDAEVRDSLFKKNITAAIKLN